MTQCYTVYRFIEYNTIWELKCDLLCSIKEHDCKHLNINVTKLLFEINAQLQGAREPWRQKHRGSRKFWLCDAEA